MKWSDDKRGMALVLSVIILVFLTALGIWAITTTTTEVKITGFHKDYERAFSLADGACEVGLKYLETHALSPPNPDPNVKGVYPSEELPSYMSCQELGYTAEISYEGYSPTPPPGWELNWQNYGGFHSRFYKVKGIGKVANSEVILSAWVLRIIR